MVDQGPFTKWWPIKGFNPFSLFWHIWIFALPPLYASVLSVARQTKRPPFPLFVSISRVFSSPSPCEQPTFVSLYRIPGFLWAIHICRATLVKFRGWALVLEELGGVERGYKNWAWFCTFIEVIGEYIHHNVMLKNDILQFLSIHHNIFFSLIIKWDNLK